MLSKIISSGILGINGYIIDVEVDLSNGLPAFDLVGLPDSAVKESRERVRTAIKNSGFLFPVKRITVNLAPAHIKKMEQSLLKADLIVMTSPAYVFHTTGAMKAFLDHFAYRWMPHRPAPEMFGKRAVIITQCLGSGAKSAAKDIRHSLSWWGISKIGIFTGALMSDIVWEKLSEKKRAELTGKVKKLSQKFAQTDYTKPAHTNWITKTKFFVCRLMQQKLHKNDPAYLDGKYWAEQGWLGKARPWKP